MRFQPGSSTPFLRQYLAEIALRPSTRIPRGRAVRARKGPEVQRIDSQTVAPKAYHPWMARSLMPRCFQEKHQNPAWHPQGSGRCGETVAPRESVGDRSNAKYLSL